MLLVNANWHLFRRKDTVKAFMNIPAHLQHNISDFYGCLTSLPNHLLHAHGGVTTVTNIFLVDFTSIVFIYMTPMEHQDREIDIFLPEFLEGIDVEDGTKRFRTGLQVVEQLSLPFLPTRRRHWNTTCQLFGELACKAVESGTSIFCTGIILLARVDSVAVAVNVHFELTQPVVRATA